MNKDNSTGTILIRWFVSYAAVLMIPLLISLAMHTASIRTVEQQTLQANALLLREIQSAFDHRLSSLERLSTTLAQDPKIASLNQALRGTPDEQYTVLDIVNDLQSYKLANEFIEEMYIYFGGNGLAVSSRYRLDDHMLHNILRVDTLQAGDDWLSHIRDTYARGFLKMDYRPYYAQKPYESVIVHLSPLTPHIENSVVVFFVIQQSQLLSSLGGEGSGNGSAVLVLDENSRVVAATPPLAAAAAGQQWERIAMDDAYGVVYDRVNGEKTVISYIRSAVTGWRYLSLVEERQFGQSVSYVQRWIWISILLCLAVGGLAVYWLIRANYNPIQRLVDKLSARSNVAATRVNELKFIEEVMQRSWEEREQVMLKLKQHDNLLRDYALLRLLKGQLGYRVPLKPLLQTHGIEFHYPLFAGGAAARGTNGMRRHGEGEGRRLAAAGEASA